MFDKMKLSEEKMIIRAANLHDAALLTEIGREAFVASHGPSASETVIEDYVSKAYTVEAFTESLADLSNFFHILFYRKKAVGYSKAVLNTECPDHPGLAAMKLDRLYFLPDYFGMGLGKQLLFHLLQIARSENQKGVWLYVWTENHRAVRFYVKSGFRIIGKNNFHLTPEHANPNHCMWMDL